MNHKDNQFVESIWVLSCTFGFMIIVLLRTNIYQSLSTLGVDTLYNLWKPPAISQTAL